MVEEKVLCVCYFADAAASTAGTSLFSLQSVLSMCVWKGKQDKAGRGMSYSACGTLVLSMDDEETTTSFVQRRLSPFCSSLLSSWTCTACAYFSSFCLLYSFFTQDSLLIQHSAPSKNLAIFACRYFSIPNSHTQWENRASVCVSMCVVLVLTSV